MVARQDPGGRAVAQGEDRFPGSGWDSKAACAGSGNSSEEQRQDSVLHSGCGVGARTRV